MRLLDQASIAYEIRSYEVDESDLSGAHAAKALHMNPDMLFKTLVARGEKTGIHIFCIPVEKELDLKKAAKLMKDKKAELVHVKDLLGLTGYVRGGCSPVGMKKNYPEFIDETCLKFDTIGVSAGARGLQLIISPEDLIRYQHMTAADLVKA